MMKVLKKVILLALVATMAISLVACGKGGEGADKSAASETVAPKATEKVEKEEAIETKEPAKESKAPDKTEAPEKSEKPEETKKPEKTKKPAETKKPEATTQPAATQAPAAPEQQQSAPAASADTARAYVGSGVGSLVAAIGQPNGKEYASSCIGEGEDGMWYYPGFTVYTYRAPNGSETVTDVM